MIAIMQARATSARLPRKVLKSLGDVPLFVYQARRILRSNKIKHLVVATSNHRSDDAIEEVCEVENLSCFRGSLDDVLSRFYYAACEYEADIVVRLTADCPLMDAAIIDRCIDMFEQGEFDYVSNCHERTFADGMDVEVLSFKALEDAYNKADLLSEREHVTPYIWKNEKKFKLGAVKDTEDLANLRLTVDHIEDFELVENIVSHFEAKGIKYFSYADIKRYLHENPDLLSINNQYSCNEGYEKSISSDTLQEEVIQ